jgi:hypothetical protein
MGWGLLHSVVHTQISIGKMQFGKGDATEAVWQPVVRRHREGRVARSVTALGAGRKAQGR